MGRRADRRAARAAATSSDPALDRLSQTIADAVAARERLGDLGPFDLPIVAACRDLLANTVAQLPLVNFRGQYPTADQPAVVLTPDPFEPRWLTLHRLVNNLTGPGYAWLVPTAHLADGYPAAVRVVDAAEAAATFDPSGRIEHIWWQGRKLRPGVDGAIWVPWRVERAGHLGTGPIGSCAAAIEYLAALWQMAGSFWEAGFPSLALVIDGALTSTQRTETKQAMLDAFARRHEPAVIDRGGRLEPVGANAVDSQLVESIAVANAEVARAFGIMPSLVNVAAGDSLTYATTEAEMSKWLKLGLGAVLSRVEAAWSTLRPYGQHVRADTSALLRSDLNGRYAAYSVAIGRWLTVDEVRRTEGMPPAPAGSLALDENETANQTTSAVPDVALTDPVGVNP